MQESLPAESLGKPKGDITGDGVSQARQGPPLCPGWWGRRPWALLPALVVWSHRVRGSLSRPEAAQASSRARPGLLWPSWRICRAWAQGGGPAGIPELREQRRPRGPGPGGGEARRWPAEGSRAKSRGRCLAPLLWQPACLLRSSPPGRPPAWACWGSGPTSCSLDGSPCPALAGQGRPESASSSPACGRL